MGTRDDPGTPPRGRFGRRLWREIRDLGFTGDYTTVTGFLRDVRPTATPVFEQRFETPPGRQAQVDFAHFRTEFADDPGQMRVVWLFSMVLGHSRLIWAPFVARQDLQAVLRCHAAAFEAIEDFFLGRSFRDLDDLNAQLRQWLDGLANQRTHATTQLVVAEHFADERPHLKPLPGKASTSPSNPRSIAAASGPRPARLHRAQRGRPPARTPGTGKSHLAIALSARRCAPAAASTSRRSPTSWARSPAPSGRGPCASASASCAGHRC